MQHTISILVANEAGELSRIVGLFSARGFNIETICVGKTLEAAWSRCTIVTFGDDRVIEQIIKQCSRLARVQEVRAVTRLPSGCGRSMHASIIEIALRWYIHGTRSSSGAGGRAGKP